MPSGTGQPPTDDRGGAVGVGEQQQRDRDGEHGGEHEDAQRPLGARVPAADEQRGRRAEQRQQHRQRGEDADHRSLPRAGGRSTSSEGMPG